jgi:hypothetical protein
MKRISVLIVSVLITLGVFAQNSDTTVTNYAHEFGFHAGATTAVGLSYRYWPGKFGLQITALPVKSSEETFISVGITGLCSFYNSRHIRFFGYFGNNLTVDNYKNYDYYSSNYTNEYSTRYNFGFGPGFGFGTRVRINLMAGYGFYDVFGEFNIYPTGEIGIYYRM